MPNKRRRDDTSIVRTEPDRRRATGRDEDDEFTMDDEEEDLHERVWITSDESRYRRTRARKLKSFNDDATFAFMNLPAEVRNMIYRCLVVSKSHQPIYLSDNKTFIRGGIEIAILLSNRLVYNEAVEILYSENRCIATYAVWEHGVGFRSDDLKTLSATPRKLRSGRAVDMRKHRGLIYESKLLSLRHVEFHIKIFEPAYCTHMAVYGVRSIAEKLQGLWALILERLSRGPENSAHGRDWVIKIYFTGGDMPRSLLWIMLLPLLSDEVVRAVESGALKLELHGKVRKVWKNIFWQFINLPGFVTENLKEVDQQPRAVDTHAVYYAMRSFIRLWDDMADGKPTKWRTQEWGDI